MSEDQKVQRRLLLAKALCARGARAVAAGDSVGRVVALVALQAAIETALRAILIKRGISSEGSGDPGFVEMVNLIAKDSSQPKIPRRQDILRINTRRNAVLHHAETIDQVTLGEYAGTTAAFLNEAFGRFFDVTQEEVSELSFITDPTLKELISLARVLNSSARRHSRSVALSTLRAVFRLAAESCLPEFSEPALVAGGVSLADYRAFAGLAYEPLMALSGRMQIRIGAVDIPENDFLWAEDFVVRTLIEWQARSYQPACVRGELFQKEIIESARKMLD